MLLLIVRFLVLRYVYVYNKDFINVSEESLLKRIASFSKNRNNAYALDLTIFDLQYYPPQAITM